MLQLFLVRHSETEMNEKGLYYGWTDCGLTENGIKQAKKLRKALRHEKFDCVISSTLSRAIHTAEIISGLNTVDIVTEPRLRELNFGEWEGMHYEQIMQKDKEHWEKWCAEWMTTAPPSGECFNDLHQRVSGFMDELLGKYKSGRILIVAHQGCLRIIASKLIKLQLENCWSFVFEHGAYSILEINDSHCVLKKLNTK